MLYTEMLGNPQQQIEMHSHLYLVHINTKNRKTLSHESYILRNIRKWLKKEPTSQNNSCFQKDDASNTCVPYYEFTTISSALKSNV